MTTIAAKIFCLKKNDDTIKDKGVSSLTDQTFLRVRDKNNPDGIDLDLSVMIFKAYVSYFLFKIKYDIDVLI